MRCGDTMVHVARRWMQYGARVCAVFAAAGALHAAADRCPGIALDHPPKLIGSLDTFRRAVRTDGYTGRIVFRLIVTDTGNARDIVVTSPARLETAQRIHDRVRQLRFCPAVKFNQYASADVHFDIAAE